MTLTCEKYFKFGQNKQPLSRQLFNKLRHMYHDPFHKLSNKMKAWGTMDSIIKKNVEGFPKN